MNPEIILWLALVVVFILVELATTALVSIWLVAGAVAALLVSLFTDSWTVELAVFAVALAFSFSTVGTMLLMVGGLLYGMRYMGNWTGKLERWNHTITGAVIAICAILMFVGL